MSRRRDVARAPRAARLASLSASSLPVWLGALCLAACAGAPAPPAEAPTPPAAQSAEERPDASATPEPESARDEAVPPAPPHCERYRSPSPPASLPAAACQSKATYREAIAAALESPADERDRSLAAAAACNLPAPGWAHALRAELAELECADVIAEEALASVPNLRSDIGDALRGLALAAQLSRLVRDPPLIDAPTREVFDVYFEQQLTPWIVAQARAVHRLSMAAARLRGYGRAAAAVEAGIADMRFVEVVRAVPLPTSMAADAEVSEAYYAALDQALEPRKARGRDAALAGLEELGSLGVLASPRVERARQLLSSLYGGRRIDALDALLLPSLPELAASSVEERLLRSLPVFYASMLLDDVDATDPRTLRAMLAQGLGERARQTLESSAISQETAALYARALVRLGQLYWRSSDFVAAARVANLSPLGGRAPSEEARLLSALAAALRNGPEDARQMMLEGPRHPEGLDDVQALEQLAREGGPLAGYAAFDAAHLQSLAPPLLEPRRAAEHWQRVATGFERAAKALPTPEEKARAHERARAARDIAGAVTRPGAS